MDKARLSAWWAHARASWYWEAVIMPFIITRLAWILSAAFAHGVLEPNPTYARYIKQGGYLTRNFLLDIFSHWDARFYLSIITDGYSSATNFTRQYSNVAFFPLYPYLVKSAGWLGINLPSAGYLLIGVLLSNACFLVSMFLLHRLATRHLALTEEATRRGMALLFVYPAAFFFSCFYTESLFLMLSLAVFVFGFERRWGWAAIAAALAVLTRVPGVLLIGVLGWQYLSARGWRLREIRWNSAWLLLAPAALAGHLYYLYRLTGNPLAFIAAQAAWVRNKYSLLEGLWIQVNAPVLDVYKLDALWVLIFLLGGLYILWKWPNKIFGLYTLLMTLIPISTGLVTSGTRYLVVIFPVFLLLGEKMKNPDGFRLAQALCFTLQVLYFAAWTNYFWVS